MSELLQSAQHPDADQLTAFAEHTLPPHEREQTLAHLATCAQCRQVVFLVQGEEPVEAVQPVVVKKPWFAGWNLVWPAALALAGIVAFSVHLRSVTTETEQTVAAVKEGRLIPAAPPLAPNVRHDIEPLPAKPKIPAKAKTDLAPSMMASVAAARRDLEQNAPLQTQSQTLGPERSRSKAPAVLHGPMINQQQQMIGGSGEAPALGYARAPVSLAQAAPPAPAMGMAGGMSLSRATAAAPSRPAAVTLGESVQVTGAADPLPAPPPPPVPKPVAPAAAQSMTVDALSDMTVTNAAPLAAASGKIAGALPGGNATVSKVSNGSRTVALDANGSVFVSKDAGVHWTAVKAQWAGRAVLVSRNAAFVPEPEKQYAARAKAAHGLSVMHHAFADSVHAQIAVVAKDGSGVPILGATFLVKSAAGVAVATSHSGSDSTFTTPALDPGKYAVQVSAPGFGTLSETMELQGGDRASLDATLPAELRATTAEVSAADSEAKEHKIKEGTFILVTDTGVSWISTDGQKWKRR